MKATNITGQQLFGEVWMMVCVLLFEDVIGDEYKHVFVWLQHLVICMFCFHSLLLIIVIGIDVLI